jgi:tripartite-type tricarboxylate transporter receptor subunit TctC
VRAKLIAARLEPMWSTPKEFADYVRAETDKWRKIVADSGAKAE